MCVCVWSTYAYGRKATLKDVFLSSTGLKSQYGVVESSLLPFQHPCLFSLGSDARKAPVACSIPHHVRRTRTISQDRGSSMMPRCHDAMTAMMARSRGRMMEADARACFPGWAQRAQFVPKSSGQSSRAGRLAGWQAGTWQPSAFTDHLHRTANS